MVSAQKSIVFPGGSAAMMGVEKGFHVESRLIRRVTVVLPDRAGMACATPKIETIGAIGTAQMPCAGGNVVTLWAKSVHWAGRQAGLCVAGGAGAWPLIGWRQRPFIGEGEGAAVGMPEAKLWID